VISLAKEKYHGRYGNREKIKKDKRKWEVMRVR